MDGMAAGTEAEAAAEEPPVGRAAARGALLGFVLVGMGVTWMTYAGGADFGGAVGVGVFVGIWGGCGFGGMMGATLCVARAEEHEAAQGQLSRAPTVDRAPVRLLEPPAENAPRPTTADEPESLRPMAS